MALYAAPPSSSSIIENTSLDVHRGAIDQTTITSRAPRQVMLKMDNLLQDMGIWVEKETSFRYRCIRLKRAQGSAPAAVDEQTQTDDRADEVRFTVELTRLAGLSGTYSLDIRRLKGNLRSYKFIYDTIRERAELN